MKPRRIVLTIEGECALPLRELRQADTVELWAGAGPIGLVAVEQIHANVIRAKPTPARKGRRR